MQKTEEALKASMINVYGSCNLPCLKCGKNSTTGIAMKS